MIGNRVLTNNALLFVAFQKAAQRDMAEIDPDRFTLVRSMACAKTTHAA